jgi:TolB-like protein/Tfp pilus assembly protein PilF
MSDSTGLFTELKRRNVFRVGAAYAVVAWLLIEVSDTVFPRLGLPEWTVTFVIALLALGFPVALFLAWAYELTPEGVKRTRDVQLDESVRKLTGRKLDLVVIAVLVLALGWFAWDRFGVHPERPEASTGLPEASIAVLPFTDMSAAGDQEYFGDGLAEEILNLLAGVRELKVSGRTSSFSFKGKDMPIPEIGRALGVAHVLEGSVRKFGDRLRITAQLVKTDDGFHVWSDTYDRRLADIFAIQDEIAGAIAKALQLTLVGEIAGAGDLDAYDLYLQARPLVYSRNPQNLREARRLIDRALEFDPDYPPALAASGELWQLLSDNPNSYGDIPAVEARTRARKDLERALLLDPGLADTHAALGLLFMNLGDHASADGHLARALSINPSLTNANHWYVLNLSRSGRAREAVAAGKRFAELDPLFLINLATMVFYHATIGELEAAEQLAQRLQRSYPEYSRAAAMMANIHLWRGRQAAAKPAIDRALELDAESLFNRGSAEWVHYLLGDCERAISYSLGVTEVLCLVSLGREAEGLARARARLDASPESAEAISAWLQGLSASGRHAELLAWMDERGYGVADLRAFFAVDISQGGGLSPLAEAQRAAGRKRELDATLRHWGETLAFLKDNGYASSWFRFNQAAHAALSNEREAALAALKEAIDAGFRDPFLAHDPAFEALHDDPEFRAQVERIRELINIERAKLGMEPLS